MWPQSLWGFRVSMLCNAMHAVKCRCFWAFNSGAFACGFNGHIQFKHKNILLLKESGEWKVNRRKTQKQTEWNENIPFSILIHIKSIFHMCAAVKRSLPYVWSYEYGSFRIVIINSHNLVATFFHVHCRTSSPSSSSHHAPGWWGISHCATFHLRFERTIYPSKRIQRRRRKKHSFSQIEKEIANA